MSDVVQFVVVVVVAMVAVNVLTKLVCWLATEWWKDPLWPLLWLCGFQKAKPSDQPSPTPAVGPEKRS